MSIRDSRRSDKPAAMLRGFESSKEAICLSPRALRVALLLDSLVGSAVRYGHQSNDASQYSNYSAHLWARA